MRKLKKEYSEYLVIVIVAAVFVIFNAKYERLGRLGNFYKVHSWSEISNNLPKIVLEIVFVSMIISLGYKSIVRVQNNSELKAKQRLDARQRFHSQVQTHECRVCGYWLEEYPWGEDGKQPSYQICPCCGVQFGKEDITPEDIEQYRAVWKKRGYKWFDKAMKPDNWDLNEQLKKAPKSWINNL